MSTLHEQLRVTARDFAHLPLYKKIAIIQEASPEEVLQLKFLWEAWARDKQLPPSGNWSVWLILAGRGSGKTRTGAEFIRMGAERDGLTRMRLIGRTEEEARAVMVEGESGLLEVCPPWFKPKWEPTKKKITWPNGAEALVYGASEPDALRGSQSERDWMDEVASWRRATEAWDNAMFGLRLGSHPQAVVTTTPKPVQIIRRLKAQPTTIVTRATSYENREYLAPSFFDEIIARYEGTRLGRQEILGEELEDVEGALWHISELDNHRVTQYPPLIQVVVAVDPAVTGNSFSADTGIVVAGRGNDGHGYVLDDLTIHGLPLAWGTQAVVGYRKYHANVIIGEQNNGGELVRQNINIVDSEVPYDAVYASRGKYTRAEPISTLYEKGIIHHVGTFPELEQELTTWEPLSGLPSPNRLDALVWALSRLFVGTVMSPEDHIRAMQRRVELAREHETKVHMVVPRIGTRQPTILELPPRPGGQQ